MIVTEPEFRDRLIELLNTTDLTHIDAVTGPGRSGAIAAVYASHHLHIPFVPYGARFPGELLIIDTAIQSGRTLRKAASRYNTSNTLAVFNEPPRVHFWYE